MSEEARWKEARAAKRRAARDAREERLQAMRDKAGEEARAFLRRVMGVSKPPEPKP